MRRHRRTYRALAAAATVLGLLAIVFAVQGSWAPFGFLIIVSAFMSEASGRAHHEYRTSRTRVRRAERVIPPYSVAPQFLACCDTWVSSADVVHGRDCSRDAGQWTA
ncbi:MULTISPECIES: hypothetical protein [unclassified Streptomyces]|uniref:hypothetical protein n=1 Tax=unclassified Streptomyces TaxID=2593676 RepID=UPI003417AB39